MNKKRATCLIIFAVVAVALFTGYLKEEPMPIEEIKSSGAVIPYDDLISNNNNHIGTIVYFEGELTDYERPALIVATKEGICPESHSICYEGDEIWVNYEGNPLYSSDHLYIWGVVEGLRTYQPSRRSRDTVTIPEITALHTEILISPSAPAITPPPPYELRIICPGKWEGSYSTGYGRSNRHDIDGKGNKFFPLDYLRDNYISARIQKKDDTNKPLTVEILRRGTVVKTESTTAAYGEIRILYL